MKLPRWPPVFGYGISSRIQWMSVGPVEVEVALVFLLKHEVGFHKALLR